MALPSEPSSGGIPKLLADLLELSTVVAKNEVEESAGESNGAKSSRTALHLQMNYNRYTLKFHDERLEVLFYDYLSSFFVGDELPSDATRLHKLYSFVRSLPYKFLLFLSLVTLTGMLSPSLMAVPQNSYAIDILPLIAWAIFIGLGAVGMLLYRFTKPCRIVSWGPEQLPSNEEIALRLQLLQKFMASVAITCLLLALAWICTFIVMERGFGTGLLVSALIRYGVIFAVFDQFPTTFFEKLLIVLVCTIVYHVTALTTYGDLSNYSPPMSPTEKYDKSAGRAVSLTVVSVVVVIVIACLAYQRELSLRKAFFHSLIAAILQREYRSLRHTTRALAEMQVPVFVHLNAQDARAAASVGGVSAAAAAAGSTSLDQVAVMQDPKATPDHSTDAFQTFACIIAIRIALQPLEVDRRMRVHQTAFELIDAAADRNDLDKVQARGEVWIGACGLRNETTHVTEYSKRAVRFACDVYSSILAEHSADATISIGIAADRTVAGPLRGARFDYQVFGAAVNESIALAMMPHAGIFLAETVLQLVDEASLPSGYALRKPTSMPRAVEHGHISTFYRALERVTLGKVMSRDLSPPPVSNASKWAKHRTAEASVMKQQEQSHREIAVFASALRAELDRPADGAGNTSARSTGKKSVTPTPAHPAARADASSSLAQVEQFLVSRGIMQMDSTSGSGSYETSYSSSGINSNNQPVDKPEGAGPSGNSDGVVAATAGGGAAGAHADPALLFTLKDKAHQEMFVLMNTAPATILACVLFVCMFIVELSADGDRFGELFVTSLSKAVAAWLAFSTLFWAGVYFYERCTSHTLLSLRAQGLAMLFTFAVFVALESARVSQLELDAPYSCGRFSRATLWAVTPAVAYTIVLLPLPYYVTCIAGALLALVWLLVIIIQSSSVADIPVLAGCPPPYPAWPRVVTLLLLVLYFITARLQQDNQLKSVFKLIRRLRIAQHKARKNTVTVLDNLQQLFTANVLAIALSRIAPGWRQLKSKDEVYKLLTKYIGRAPAKRSWWTRLWHTRASNTSSDAFAAAATSPLYANVDDVVILSMEMSTVRKLSGMLSPEDTMAVLSSLVAMLDKACASMGGVRVALLGSRYTAAFGLPQEQSEQVVKAFKAMLATPGAALPDFSALQQHVPSAAKNIINAMLAFGECISTFRNIGNRYGVDLVLHAGVACGSVVVGALGLRYVQFQAIGEPVTASQALLLHAKHDADVLLTDKALAKLRVLHPELEKWNLFEHLADEFAYKAEWSEQLSTWLLAMQAGDLTALSAPTASNAPNSSRAVKLGYQDFKLLGPLGSGHFATVFLSVHRKTGNAFAVKVLESHSTKSKSLQAELRALASPTQHPCVVEFICALDGPNDETWLLQEYIEGCTLEALLNKLGALPEHIVKKVIAELVSGVGHLHQLGIIHRDIKPANILITKSGHVKLIDLGLAALVHVDEGARSDRQHSDTSSYRNRLQKEHSTSKAQPVDASAATNNTATSSSEKAYPSSSGEDGSGSTILTDRPATGDRMPLIALLQTLLPRPDGKVMRRLLAKADDSLKDVVGTALLIDPFQSDPLASTKSIYEALRLYGLWVMEANSMREAITLITRHGQRVVDVMVVILRNARDVDQAIKWRNDPLLVSKLSAFPYCGLLPAEVPGLEGLRTRLGRAGFSMVLTMPLSTENIESIVRLASAHSGLDREAYHVATGALPTIAEDSGGSTGTKSQDSDKAAGRSDSSNNYKETPSPPPETYSPQMTALRGREYSATHNFAQAVTRNALQETVASIAGTPFAMAPETLKRATGLVSDWFSVGVTAFRCVSGHYPFGGETRAAVHKNIKLNNVAWEHLPATVSSEFREFLRELLQPDPKNRLGRKGDASEVMQHACFAELQPWDLSCSRMDYTIFSAEQLSSNALVSLSDNAPLKLSIDWLNRSMSRESGRISFGNVGMDAKASVSDVHLEAFHSIIDMEE